ncbi:hypothetical protein BpHYR1_009981 [Brachionus plicatilis]|uniref:Uncharacterized protein n=1 Tax=Brachionus plicatilis TaxID=10195 RepID=A0A3M7RGA6_BRAPC|nr:hypothetical protein BpHYR1_009981 [Brachionus plicatilis]
MTTGAKNIKNKTFTGMSISARFLVRVLNLASFGFLITKLSFWSPIVLPFLCSVWVPTLGFFMLNFFDCCATLTIMITLQVNIMKNDASLAALADYSGLVECRVRLHIATLEYQKVA